MAVLVRVLLWTLVLVAPGGILLAPWVLAREIENRRATGPVQKT